MCVNLILFGAHVNDEQTGRRISIYITDPIAHKQLAETAKIIDRSMSWIVQTLILNYCLGLERGYLRQLAKDSDGQETL